MGKMWVSYKKNNVYPTLAALARKYLCVPASSIYSERLFSEYNGLYEKKRSRIKPDCAEQVLFLHHNWERVESNGRKVNAESGQKGHDDFADVDEDVVEQAKIDALEANAEMDNDIWNTPFEHPLWTPPWKKTVLKV